MITHSPLSGIAQIVQAKSKRISSYDRKGGNGDCCYIPAGETFVMAEMKGAGIVKHIWITISCVDPLVRKNLVLRMFWDGCEHPSVEAPVGDFFGQGWGDKYDFISLPLAAAPAGGNALVCYFPMPFGNGARIEVVNESAEPIQSFYYYVEDGRRRGTIPRLVQPGTHEA